MFGTEIHWVTFIYTILQFIILLIQIMNYYERPKDKTRSRFLILTALFTSYNLVSGLVPDTNIPVPVLFQNILAWSIGITTAFYLLYYIYIEHSIKPLRFLSIKNILYATLASFIILFLIPYVITQNLSFSRNIFLGLPLLISLICLINIIYVLTKDFINSENNHYRFRIFAGGIGIISIVSLPLVILTLGDHQLIEHSAFSIGYFAIAIAYIKHHIYNSRIEYEFLVQHKIEKNITSIHDDNSTKAKSPLSILTSREKEIVLFLIAGYPTSRISEEIYIPNSEVKTHIDTIYNRIGVSTTEELLEVIPESVIDKPLPEVLQQKRKISERVTQEILANLEKLEKRNFFLSSEVNLQQLAKKINTNSKYLSMTINMHKNQSFKAYINSLRIAYAQEKIQNDYQFRGYSIEFIAKDVGFNTSESFSKAFYKQTQKHPSQFIKDVEKEYC